MNSAWIKKASARNPRTVVDALASRLRSRCRTDAESCRRPESATTSRIHTAGAGDPGKSPCRGHRTARGEAASRARPGISSPNPTAHLAGAGEEFAMPAKGKHRRPKPRSLTRGIVVAGTGGAALAMPLHRCRRRPRRGRPPVRRRTTPRSAPRRRPPRRPRPPRPSTHVHRGPPATTLAKIADDQHVSGGWKKLYADNREAVGDNPRLIHPGLKLPRAEGRRPEGQAPRSPGRRAGPREARRRRPTRTRRQTAPSAPPATPSPSTAPPSAPPTTRPAPAGPAATTPVWTSWSATGTTVHSVAAGTVVSRRLGRLVRQRGRHQARRRQVLAVRPPDRPGRLGRPDRHRGPADRPLRRDRQCHRPAPALRGPHHPGLRLGHRPGRVPALARCRHRLTRLPTCS